VFNPLVHPSPISFENKMKSFFDYVNTTDSFYVKDGRLLPLPMETNICAMTGHDIVSSGKYAPWTGRDYY
jgi:hypothetical protein